MSRLIKGLGFYGATAWLIGSFCGIHAFLTQTPDPSAKELFAIFLIAYGYVLGSPNMVVKFLAYSGLVAWAIFWVFYTGLATNNKGQGTNKEDVT